MLLPKSLRARRKPPDGPVLARAVRNLIRFVVVSAFRITAIAVLIAGVVYLRLMQGPMHLPFVGKALVKAFNEQSERLEVGLGDVVLTLVAGDITLVGRELLTLLGGKAA